MARPRKIEVIEVEKEPENWEEIDSDPEVDRVKAELGDKAKSITIQSYNRAIRKWDYLEKMEVGNFSLEYIKHTYGGGEYRARILDGDNKYIGHYSFSVSNRFTIPLENQSTIPQAVQIPSDGKIDRIERMLEKLIEVQTLSLQQKQERDPLEIALKISEIIKNNQPTQSPQNNSWTDAFSIFKQGMELGTMSAEGGGSYWPVIEKIGQPALELLNKVVNQGEKVLDKAKESNKQNGNTPQPMRLKDYLNRYVPLAVNLALKGKDPELYADLLLDQIPENLYEEVHLAFSKENALEDLCKEYPALLPHIEWFKSFSSRILESLTPEITENTTSVSNEVEN